MSRPIRTASTTRPTARQRAGMLVALYGLSLAALLLLGAWLAPAIEAHPL